MFTEEEIKQLEAERDAWKVDPRGISHLYIKAFNFVIAESEQSRPGFIYTLEYYKDTGKWYTSSGLLHSKKSTEYEVHEEVFAMLKAGKCPGLKDDAVLRNGFDTCLTFRNSDHPGWFILSSKLV